MFNLENLEEVRSEMLSEIQADIRSKRLYLSDRLNQVGTKQYPNVLIDAAKTKDIEGFINSFGMSNFNLQVDRRNPDGTFSKVKMPSNANVTLCEGEFNRFYMRAVCIKAISSGISTVIVYRARHSEHPRPESLALEGTEINAAKLLSDLREKIGVDTVLGLPPGPNSGLSVRLPNN